MSQEIKAWKCENCGSAYMNKISADDCCKEFKNKVYHCKVCGVEVPEYRTICNTCLSKERYEKGTKFKYSEYKLEWLWDEDSDNYFSDIDAMDDYYSDRDLPLPKWCYGCDSILFSIDIDSALESASEEMYEDFDYGTDATDIEELYDFIKYWNEKQSAKSYGSNYGKIILLDE